MSEDQGHLIEVPQFRFGTTLLISLWSSLVTTVLMVLVVSTCFVAINVFFFLAEGQLFQQFAGKLVKGVPLFAGFSFAFIGVITLPVSLVWGVTKRAKYIAVEGNSFVVETAWSFRMSLDDSSPWLRQCRLLSTKLESNSCWLDRSNFGLPLRVRIYRECVRILEVFSHA